MPVIEVMLKVPLKIAAGLASGQLERVGGVIREAGSKKIVAFLREGGKFKHSNDPAALPKFLFQSLLQGKDLAEIGGSASITRQLQRLHGALGIVASGSNAVGVFNLAATARSHYLINLRLQAIQNMLSFTTRLSMLQLSLSGFGLLMMINRFAHLEQLLNEIKGEIVDSVDSLIKSKIKVGMESALECARVVSEASDRDYRIAVAANLDFLLVNAREHCMTELQSKLEKKSWSGSIEEALLNHKQAMHLDETRTRTFLEIGENNLADSAIKKSLELHRKQSKRIICKLLGEQKQRAVYFNDKVSDSDLHRYLLIEQWLRGKEDILWEIVHEQRKLFWDNEAIKALAPAGGIVLPGTAAPKAPTQHLNALEQAEEVIENFQRFEGFALELDALSRLSISPKDWDEMHNTDNTVFVNEADVNLDEHNDYVLLVERDYLDSIKRLSD